MSSKTKYPIREIHGHFRLESEVVRAAPFGDGNINDTFRVETFDSVFLLQRINTNVFPDPEGVMNNIIRVTDHIRRKLEGKTHEPDRHVLHFVQTTDGHYCYLDPDGNAWRVYHFVDRVTVCEVMTSSEQAYEAACAFAWFQNQLADFPAPRLKETIPDFHNGLKRLEAFREAVRQDVAGRLERVVPLVDFVESRADICSRMMRLIRTGVIPERVVHNDTKINNVLFDEVTGHGICVIDLDTVMPGSALFDFGDLVRSAAAKMSESETNLAKVDFDMDRFRAIVRGYRKEAPFLTDAEWDEMVFSIHYMVFVLGMRFLTDFLNGDTYFKTKYPDHNLVRAKVQFRYLGILECEADKMREIVRSIRP